MAFAFSEIEIGRRKVSDETGVGQIGYRSSLATLLKSEQCIRHFLHASVSGNGAVDRLVCVLSTADTCRASERAGSLDMENFCAVRLKLT